MPGVSAILTAAGLSTRMGRNKSILPWMGETLIEYQIRCLTEGGASEVVVVLGHRADSIRELVNGPRVSWVYNGDFRQGRTSSILKGLEAIAYDADNILLLGVDQPRSRDIVSRIISTHVGAKALITSPRYQGQGGHPLVFSKDLLRELRTLTEGSEGLRQVFRNHRTEVREVEFEDPIIRLDLNTAEDYQLAFRHYGSDTKS